MVTVFADLCLRLGKQQSVFESCMMEILLEPRWNDRRQIISGVLDVLIYCCPERDGSSAYGPRLAVYDRFDW